MKLPLSQDLQFKCVASSYHWAQLVHGSSSHFLDARASLLEILELDFKLQAVGKLAYLLENLNLVIFQKGTKSTSKKVDAMLPDCLCFITDNESIIISQFLLQLQLSFPTRALPLILLTGQRSKLTGSQLISSDVQLLKKANTQFNLSFCYGSLCSK